MLLCDSVSVLGKGGIAPGVYFQADADAIGPRLEGSKR